MRKIEPEFITGMGYIGASPGVLYRMGGAGEQTVVTGNPALLEGVKGNRFTSLTLHGISTQGSTTGAQLFDVSNADVVQMYIANSGIGNFIENYSVIIPIKPSTSYTISEKNNKIFRVAITEEYPIESAPTLFKDVAVVYKNITTPNNLPNGNFLMIQLYGNFNHAPDFSGLMLNEGSTTKPWEPYTGGAPSPSPSYPQEIESAGQDGEIGVEVLGKNLIPFPYPILGGAGTQIERGGVKYTVQSDGGIRCVGTPTAVGYINLSRIKFSNVGLTAMHPTDGKIVLSGEKMAYDPSNHALFIYITSDQLGKLIDTVIYPQIEFGTVATEYEPYRPAQTLIIPTPNGLPGVPTIDNGNYTDASGQQWLCDEVDLKRGVYVQNVAFAEFGKGITSLTKNSGVSSKNIVSAYFFSIPRKRAKTRHTIMSNCLRFVANVSSGNPAYVISNESQTEAMYVSIPAELYENDDQMLNLLAEKKVKILYATYPTERPLSTEELEKYRSLRTYSPTTTVINDAGAGMSVGYKRK